MDKTQKRFKFKELMDALPMNTLEAKRKLAESYGIHPSKIRRWYSSRGKANIKLSDALALVQFFGLETPEELFSVPAKQKPVKALQKN